MARLLRRNLCDPLVVPRAMRGFVKTLTIPTLLSGCAHQAPSVPPQAGISPTPKKVVFYPRRSNSLSNSIGAFDGGAEEVAALPPSDYLIVEEIVSRRAKIAERTRLERERLTEQAAVPDAQARRKARIIERLRKDRLGKAYAKAPRFPIRSTVRLAGTPTFMPVRPWVGSSARDGLWQQVRANLMLAQVEHERVDAQIEEFRRHPGRVTYLAQRAQPFLPHIVGELGRRGLPADLVLVPMVESGFEPTALSPKAAAGIWQIIPSTGIEHGLMVNETYDARYDVQASTKAALSYLKHLSELFRGDWLLALAAYNCGEGAVQRAMAANLKAGKGTSFWELNLPTETEAYVPKIVALARLFANPEGFGIRLRNAGTAPQFGSVALGSQVRLADVMAAAGIEPGEFFRLNPAFKPNVEPPQQNYTVLLPIDKAKTIAANLPGAKFLGGQTIVVKKGDTLEKLAKRAGVSKLKLAEWNGLTPDTSLTPGQELLVFPV